MTNVKPLNKPAGPARKTPAPPPSTPAGTGGYQPLPVDCLPEPIRSIVRAGSPAFDCDPSYLALPCLAVAASCIGNTRAIELKRGFVQPCVLWFVLIGKSGSGKSPPFRWATQPVYRRQNELLRAWKKTDEDYQADLRAWEHAEKERFRKKGEDFVEPRPEKPSCRRLVTNDPTLESLYPVLEDNPRGILLARDELGAFFANMARYKTSGSDLQGWLEMYEGGAFVVDRRGGDKPVRSISRASVSIAGGIQPGTLQRGLTDEYLEAGLGARFLAAWPPDKQRKWVETEIDALTAYQWDRLIEVLLDLEFADGAAADPYPVLHTLEPEAKTEWVRWYDSWAAVVAETGNEFLAAAYSKVPGQAARLALLHHVVTCAWDNACQNPNPAGPIPLESLQAGTTLATWFAGESARVYRASTPEQALIAWIKKQGGKVTVRDLVTAKKFGRATDAFAALDTLVSQGKGKWLEEEKKTRFFCLLSSDRPDEK